MGQLAAQINRVCSDCRDWRIRTCEAESQPVRGNQRGERGEKDWRVEAEGEKTYLFSRGLMAPGARFSRFEVPRAKLLFFVGVLRAALLEREFNQEEDLGNRFAI